jgi:hypothetical protein
MMYNNFLSLRSKRRMSPAVATGVSDWLSEIGNFVALLET